MAPRHRRLVFSHLASKGVRIVTPPNGMCKSISSMADQTSEPASAKRSHEETENKSIPEPANDHASKKPKLDHAEGTNGTTDDTDVIQSFGGFQVTKVLNEDSQRKSIFLLGRFGDSKKDAVVMLEKTPFSEDVAKDMLTKTSMLKNVMHNDIYGTYQLFPKQELNALKTTLIYPATEKHIAKYSSTQAFLITETADDYTDITLPYLESERFSLDWVYNILDKKSEVERIIYEDPDAEQGFMVMPDMKWNEKLTEDLYVMGLVRRRGIRTLRDLTAVHLPMLKNMLAKGKAAIWERYQVPGNKLRIYVHYMPSYYHFHVHFTHINYNAPGSGTERAHMLTNVINNLEIDSSYYRKSTLSFVVRENDKLCARFQEAGRI